MASKDPEIAPTVSFRPVSAEVADKVIEDHKSGFLEQAIPTARGKKPSLLPPTPKGAAPKTSLSSRLRAHLDKGG
jgi:hypothetical protein